MKDNKLLTSVLLIALGIALIIVNKAAAGVIMGILGAGLIILGAVMIYQQITGKGSDSTEALSRYVLGGLCVVLGIVVLCNTAFFFKVAKFIIGGVIILFGIKDLIPAIQEKSEPMRLLIPAVAIVLGIIIMLISPGALFVIAGIALIVVGAVSLIGEIKT